jgi:hypothetical protein
VHKGNALEGVPLIVLRKQWDRDVVHIFQLRNSYPTHFKRVDVTTTKNIIDSGTE